MALRQLRSPGLGLGWLFLRVISFAAAVPVLMRLKLPVLNRLLERRIASAAEAGGDANEPGQIVRCVESALAVGAPLVRPGCLTRGLTLYYFLRRAGLDVMLCFGVRWRNGELTGHCWLEKGGEPFLEEGSLDRYAVPIYSLPATGADRETRGARGIRRLAFLALALASLQGLTTAGSAAAAPLRIELNTNTVCLVVGPISEPGALFVLAAPDLPSLAATPAVMLQTNTPFTNELRLPVSTAGGFSNGGFFRAAYWAGQAPALVRIPMGTFLMGSPESELDRLPCEGPQTEVTLTNDFRMGEYDVTQAQYQALMTNNPSYFTGDSNRPVEQVSWDDAMEYCQLLTAAQRLAGCLPAGWAYRLPTEAEWEYACRAGTTTPFNLGPDLRSGMADFDGCYEYYATLGEVYNPNGIRLWRTADVGGYAPNAWGLYDMHGNVWEWCLDWWTPSLPGGSVTNPTGPAMGSNRVVRGGSWYDAGRWCRSAYRAYNPQSYVGNATGFRVVLAPPQP